MDSENDGIKSTSTLAADGGISMYGESYEGSTSEDRNLTNLIHGTKYMELNPNQDGERALTGSDIVNQPVVTNTGSDFSNSWPQFIDFEETIGEGDSIPQQSVGNLGSWEPEQLQSGWQWPERAGKLGSQTCFQGSSSNVYPQEELITVNDPEFDKASVYINDELLDDSEDDISDGFDSDDCEESHEKRKKNKWLRPFFESLNSLSLEEINEEARQWHCPACQDGPGSIDWFIGLQPLLAHAKTKGKIRLRLHRELAELLEEELRRKGISFISTGAAYGKWMGLCETTVDREIVWPPMVIVMNTMLEKDENDKWKGMGNQELLAYFNNYKAVKARHSYGPNGHRGMSVLIFEASSMGYLEAERLHKQFLGEGRDRDSWERHPVLFYPGGKRQLYGFLASKEDLIIFNRHSYGKARLKFNLRSYYEMVVSPLKKMNEDNQKLIWLKNKNIQLEQHSKGVEKKFVAVSQNVCDNYEENQIASLRTEIHHIENKDELDYQERFFKDQMDKLHCAAGKKEAAFQKFLQGRRRNVKQSDIRSGTSIDCNQREEEIQSSFICHAKSVQEFEEEREELSRLHEQNKIELKGKHLAEDIELERSFVNHLTKLIEKYAPPTPQVCYSS